MPLTKKKKIIISGTTVLIAMLIGYWFFYHTVRGGAFAVYIFGGIHAPLSVKWECGAITDANVEKKFMLPLLFDEKTKNELRGFWYYSYFRQCLYNNGYDFSGNVVPDSNISENTYSNSYGGFSFSVPEKTTLTSDNKLDVDFHDQLLVSTLTMGSETLFIHAYLKNDDFKTFDDLKTNLQYISLSKADIENSDIVKNAQGAEVLRVRDIEGTEGIVFLTPSLHVVYIFGGPTLKGTLDVIASSISNL